jgi:TolC family type I secretion outer membrane protein
MRITISTCLLLCLAAVPDGATIAQDGAGSETATIAATTPATSLEEAFAYAYGDSPTLRADREGLKILDEDVAAARSQGRPVIQAEGTLTRAEMDVKGTGYIVGAKVTQPLFRGFRVINNIRAAKSSVQAGRESLRQSEIDAFRDIAQQYSAVLRDREVMTLTQTMIDNLTTIRQAEERRLELGERTKTDVAQSDARLASASATYSRAQQRLAESEARFRALVGKSAGTLTPLPPLPQLPTSRDQALDLAMTYSPRIRQKKLDADVAKHQLDAAKGALAPSVDLIASVNHRDEIVQILGRKLRQDLATFQATVTVPIYQGGQEYAAIRRAAHTRNVRMIEIDEETRSVYADAAVAWDRLVTAQQARDALSDAIRANEIAVAGVRREALHGSRTTLDILDAESELRDARVAYANAEHDEYMAKFGLLSAIGTATASDFHLEVKPYNPDDHYRATQTRWIGFGP